MALWHHPAPPVSCTCSHCWWVMSLQRKLMVGMDQDLPKGILGQGQGANHRLALILVWCGGSFALSPSPFLFFGLPCSLPSDSLSPAPRSLCLHPSRFPVRPLRDYLIPQGGWELRLLMRKEGRGSRASPHSLPLPGPGALQCLQRSTSWRFCRKLQARSSAGRPRLEP